MPSFRHFVALALTAAFAAAPVGAQATTAAASGKTVLQTADFPARGYTTEVVRTVLGPNARAPLHMHPGIESGYIVKGGGMVHIQGKPALAMRPGDTTVVPPNTPHWFVNGPETTEIVSTYVLEKDKPARQVLAADAPELGRATGSVDPYPSAPDNANKGLAVLQSVAYPGQGYYTRIARVEVPANAAAPQHEHPGIEVTYVLAGSVTLAIAGKPERVLHAGESFLIPAGTTHKIVNGASASELLSTYVLEEGKPLMHVMK